MSGKYVAGVHVRNDAHKTECINGEAVPFNIYVERLRNIFDSRNGACLIFLATDVEEVVEKFRAVFGDKVFVQPGVTRSDRQGEDFIHEIHQSNPNPDLKLGEDVLIDCLLLSKCDILVHTVSNISTAAGYINPEMEMVYCE